MAENILDAYAESEEFGGSSIEKQPDFLDPHEEFAWKRKLRHQLQAGLKKVNSTKKSNKDNDAYRSQRKKDNRAKRQAKKKNR